MSNIWKRISFLLFLNLFVLGFFSLFLVQQVEACTCRCYYATGCHSNIPPGSCMISNTTHVGSGSSSGSTCHISPSISCKSWYCSSGICGSKGSLYHLNSCQIGGSGGPPSTCTNTCPCTASNKSAPWIQGTAPVGYIDSCKATTSCSGKKSNCNHCSSFKSWYKPNLPTTPPPIANKVQYCLNGACVNLSTDSNNPTVVAPAKSGDTIRLKVITGAKDPDARAWRYWWRLNNITISAPWTCPSKDDGSVNVSNPQSDNDVCQKNDTNNTTINLVNTLIVSNTYYVAYNTGWLRTCTEDPLYQANAGPEAVIGYFRVDNIPTEVGGHSDTTISGTEVDTDNGRSCSDNNPFEFDIIYQDLDGVADFKELGFWVDDKSPSFSQMRNSIRGKIVRSGGSWKARGLSCDVNGLNCSWNVIGSLVPNPLQNICTTSTDWSDYVYPSSSCDSSIGSWTVLDIEELNSTDIKVTYKIWVDGNIGTSLDIYGKSWDTHGASNSWTDLLDRTLDLVAPTTTMVSPLRVVNNTEAELDWNVVDSLSGVADIYGSARLHTSGLVDGPLSDLTSGVSNYAIDGSESRDLWHDSWSTKKTSVSGTERIDFLTNEGNEISFGGDSVDNACNMAGSLALMVQKLDDPWFISRGGSVYSSAGVVSPSRSISGSGTLSTLTPEVALWSSPFRFATEDPSIAGNVNDIAPSTELFSIGGGSWDFSSSVDNPAIGFGLSGYSDRLNNELMYKSMYESITSDYGSGVPILSLVGNSIDTSVISKSSDLKDCASSNICLYTVSGNLEILTTSSPTPFTCDKPTVFVVSGDILLEPDIIKGTGSKDGCMFIAGGNITVDTGMVQDVNPNCNSGTLDDAEICYPPYDLIEGFLMADGHIILDEDFSSLLYEGLLVHGSLIAFGGNISDSSIYWSRTLKLLNNPRFPSLVIHHDPVYLDLAKSVFIFDYPAYVVDIGYKP